MVLIIGSLGFVLVQLAPGDPVTALAGEFAHEDVQQRTEGGGDPPMPRAGERLAHQPSRLELVEPAIVRHVVQLVHGPG